MAGTIIQDQAAQPALDQPVSRQPASPSTRRKPLIVATPEEAEGLIADPSDDVARQALAKAKVRTAKARKTPARTTARTPGRTRGASPQRRTAVERLDDPPPASGAALIERVSRAVERELSQIEVIVGGHHVKPAQRTEAERRARTLASLAKTLGEVMRLRMQDQKVKPADDDVPRDLDEFRQELSRRLERMVRSREAVSAGGDEPR